MKKPFLLSIIILYSIISKAQEITVGTGKCGTSITQSIPAKYDNGSWNGGKNNSWSLLLYTKEDLNIVTGNLTDLGFYIDCGSTKTYTTLSSQRIYIKETNQNEITSVNISDISTFTKVYDGNITWKRGSNLSASKNIISLTNPFNYSGTKNLLIYFENESATNVSMFGSIPFLWDNHGENKVSYSQYKLSNKNNSTGYIDKTLPVTYFKFSTPTTPPIITMELDQNICSGSSFSFTTVNVIPTTPTLTLKWTTSGTGIFNNNQIRNPIYTPSTLDKTNGSVILTLTATNSDGSSNTDFTLSISTPPNASIKNK